MSGSSLYGLHFQAQSAAIDNDKFDKGNILIGKATIYASVFRHISEAFGHRKLHLWQVAL
jgi:hypothetical protein